MDNHSYFGGIGNAIKTLLLGMKTTIREYFTPKSTEQYPENRKTTLHVSPRFRGRLIFLDPIKLRAADRPQQVFEERAEERTLLNRRPDDTFPIQ